MNRCRATQENKHKHEQQALILYPRSPSSWGNCLGEVTDLTQDSCVESATSPKQFPQELRETRMRFDACCSCLCLFS